MKVQKYRFYIAWFQNSDGAGGDDTNVFSQADLIPEYNKGNENVNMFEYDAPEGFEWEVGASIAFKHNFTAHDSTSIAVLA